ncbi:hypothetical protein LXL04_004523 [Taraxacum kok-saghyz]
MTYNKAKHAITYTPVTNSGQKEFAPNTRSPVSPYNTNHIKNHHHLLLLDEFESRSGHQLRGNANVATISTGRKSLSAPNEKFALKVEKTSITNLDGSNENKLLKRERENKSRPLIFHAEKHLI